MTGKPAMRFQHMALEVADMDRSIGFYRGFLGMKLTERHAAGEVAAIPVELAFLRLGRTHHDLVLAHNPAKTYRQKPARPEDDSDGVASFHHLAIECPDRAAFLEMLAKAESIGLAVVRGPVVHSRWDPRGDGSWGENESFYVLDPDNHRLEIFCDMGSVGVDGVFINYAGSSLEGSKADEV